MTTAPERPPLSRGKLATDIVLAGVFGALCLPFALLGDPADLVALLLFAGALAIRRLRPGWALGIAWVAAVVQMATLRDLQLYDAAVLGVLYSSAAHGERLLKWLGLASAGVGAVVATLYIGFVKPVFDGAGFPADSRDSIGMAFWILFLFIASLAVLVLAWVSGLLVRAVRDAREIRRREEDATRQRELAEYRYVVEQERNRIARDMHDVVAHSLAVVIAQADGARFAAATRPEASVDALGTIAQVARGALGDVRMLLAELRHDEGEAPQPVLDDLEALLGRVRAAGLDLRVAEVGDRVPLGTGHQIAVYRIIQEGLTNALRHGDTAGPVVLRLTWSSRGVVIDIANDVRPDSAREISGFRHGIPGMRERAHLAGGTLTAGFEGDDRFRMIAQVPAVAAPGGNQTTTTDHGRPA